MGLITKNLGRLSIVWKGQYDHNTAYKHLDVVKYDTNIYIYINKNSSSNKKPDTSKDFWSLLAKGIDIMSKKGDILTLGELGTKTIPLGEQNSFLMSEKQNIKWVPISSIYKKQNQHYLYNFKFCNQHDQETSYTNTWGFIPETNIIILDWAERTVDSFTDYETISKKKITTCLCPDKNTYIKDIINMGFSCFILKDNGDVYAYGYNKQGELGLGDTENRLVTNISKVKFPDDNEKIRKIVTCNRNSYTDDSSAFFISKTDKLYATGHNEYGELGLGTTTNQSSPQLVLTDCKDFSVSSSSLITAFALKNNGDVYSWGVNYYGELGLGDSSSNNFVKSPQKVKITMPVKKVVTNYTYRAYYSHGFKTNSHYFKGHTLFLTQTGEVFGCGKNDSYQMGNRHTMIITTPEKIDELGNNNKDIFVRNEGSLIIKNNNSVYTLGKVPGNNKDITYHPFEVFNSSFVESKQKIKKIISISYNIGYSWFVLFENGEAFCWGDNSVLTRNNSYMFYDRHKILHPMKININDIKDIYIQGSLYYYNKKGLNKGFSWLGSIEYQTNSGVFYQNGAGSYVKGTDNIFIPSAISLTSYNDKYTQFLEKIINNNVDKNELCQE